MKTFATTNITKIDKYKKTEQHCFGRTQNRHEHYYDGAQKRTQRQFGE